MVPVVALEGLVHPILEPEEDSVTVVCHERSDFVGFLTDHRELRLLWF
jgi:hypothetical protein